MTKSRLRFLYEALPELLDPLGSQPPFSSLELWLHHQILQSEASFSLVFPLVAQQDLHALPGSFLTSHSPLQASHSSLSSCGGSHHLQRPFEFFSLVLSPPAQFLQAYPLQPVSSSSFSEVPHPLVPLQWLHAVLVSSPS